jgi:uncharacterized protein YndB with AHSA1/START domain
VIDITTQIDAIHREVSRQVNESGEVVRAVLRRGYDAPIEDVWDAVTDPERIKRWLMPLSGDLREGGDFQLEGIESGRILRCEPPHRLKVTWGAEGSIVEVRLTPHGEGSTTLELEHTVPIEMAGSGAHALYVGSGWDGAFMSLGRYLAGQVADDPVAAANSPETQEFNRQSVHAWTAVIEKSGTAGPDDIAAAVEASLAQVAPETSGPPDQNGRT